jgi:hypothetical protein
MTFMGYLYSMTSDKWPRMRALVNSVRLPSLAKSDGKESKTANSAFIIACAP